MIQSTSSGSGDDINETEYLVSETEKTNGISTIAVGSTIINILLATGPFSLPYAFAHGGVYLAGGMLIIIGFISFLSADLMIEIIAFAQAKRSNEGIDDVCTLVSDPADSEIEGSSFFIRAKLEIGLLCEYFTKRGGTVIFLIILTIYLYGAMIIKCVSAAESLSSAISYIFYNDLTIIDEKFGFKFYYVCVAIFAGVVTIFSVGNIENSKWLQIIVAILRAISVLLMIIGSFYVIGTYGPSTYKEVKEFEIGSMDIIEGNELFVFMFHHSIPGIFYPLRPQTKTRKTTIICVILGGLILMFECIVGVIAFGQFPEDDQGHFPAGIKDLFNKNFLGIPFIGEFVNFYPMLNVAAYPVLAISLRNNFIQILGFEKNNKGISKRGKVISTICFTLPVYLVSLFFDHPQELLAYTGGLSGACLMMVLPLTLAFFSRRAKLENKLKEKNVNKSLFQGLGWIIFLIFATIVVLGLVIYGLVMKSLR